MSPRKSKNRRKTRKLNLRRPRLPQGPREWALALVKWGAISGLALMAIGAATVALLFWIYGSDPDLPRIAKLSDYDPLEVSRVQSKDGAVIGEVFEERRTFVPYEKIPKVVVQAFISAEDAKFFEHEGIDYFGMFRALLVNLKSGKKRQGASTITQQVVKTFLLTPERTFKRKFQEIILARRLEDALSKEEILSLYLNQIYFGHGRYGVEQASQYYFGKSVSDLNPGEAAMIAGLPQAPENISPKKVKNQERAKFRQTYVLEQMVHHGYLEEVEAQKWVDEPIVVVNDPFPSVGDAPEWVEVARSVLVDQFGDDGANRAGVALTMTVDLEVQRHANEALRAGLQALDARQGYGHATGRVRENKVPLEVTKLARKLKGKQPAPGRRYRAIVVEVHDADNEIVVDLGKWKASVVLEPVDSGNPDRYNPKGAKPSGRFHVGDQVKVVVLADDASPEAKHSEHRVALTKGPEGAVVVLDPKTREVIAMVGGYSNRIGDFNRALQAKRQPGSTFKPLVYAAAIDSGDFTAASIVNDAPEVFDLWKPENYKKGKFEGPVRLRYALAKSINTVAIRVMHDVGPERVAELAHALGIKSELPEQLSLALGSGEVTPLELANAFASLAAGGIAADPVLVRKVGEDSPERGASKRVLRPEIAYVVIDMMKSVITEGTGGRARKLGITLAGKTGTSNSAKDAWFVGMTPDLVICVWVGFDEPRALGRREGGSTSALPIFVDLAQRLRLRDRHFPRPKSIVEKRIDRATGLVAAATAPESSAYREVFVGGTEPTEVAPLPGEVAADEFVLNQYDEYDGYEDQDEDEDAPDKPAKAPAPRVNAP